MLPLAAFDGALGRIRVRATRPHSWLCQKGSVEFRATKISGVFSASACSQQFLSIRIFSSQGMQTRSYLEYYSVILKVLQLLSYLVEGRLSLSMLTSRSWTCSNAAYISKMRLRLFFRRRDKRTVFCAPLLSMYVETGQYNSGRTQSSPFQVTDEMNQYCRSVACSLRLTSMMFDADSTLYLQDGLQQKGSQLRMLLLSHSNNHWYHGTVPCHSTLTLAETLIIIEAMISFLSALLYHSISWNKMVFGDIITILKW